MELISLRGNKRGAALPLVTIIICFVVFGIIALVVDAGMIYAEKKAMVTAADAGALAGAQVLKQSKGLDIASAVSQAALFVDYNGAKAEPIPNVYYRDGRQVIEVIAQEEKENFFAKLIGFETTTVKSKAVATWGYYKEYDVDGSILPLFTFDTVFESSSGSAVQFGLHEDNVGGSPPNYGYVDIGNIKKLLEGDQYKGTITPILYSKDGEVNNLDVSITNRLQKALLQPTVGEREMYMTGLIPVIDAEAFVNKYFDGTYDISDVLSNPDAYTKGGQHWWEAHLELKVKYFAYFVIEDVIFKNQPYGLGASIYSSGYTAHYNPSRLNKGNGINYSDGLNLTVNGKEITKYKVPASGPEASTIIGRYTGETTDRAKIVDGDQNDPDPSVEGEAAYYKLIE